MPTLCISRRPGESFTVDGPASIKIDYIRYFNGQPSDIRIQITAPASTRILRNELLPQLSPETKSELRT